MKQIGLIRSPRFVQAQQIKNYRESELAESIALGKFPTERRSWLKALLSIWMGKVLSVFNRRRER